MKAPLPEVPAASSTKHRSDAPEGLRWIVALQIGVFFVSIAGVVGPMFFEMVEEGSKPLSFLFVLGAFGLVITLYGLLFFFLGRGSQWARWIFIVLFVCLYGSDFLWPDFFKSEEPSPLWEGVVGYVLDALWIWTLIYLFLPKVRAYFGSR